jgi:hypothetical protein
MSETVGKSGTVEEPEVAADGAEEAAGSDGRQGFGGGLLHRLRNRDTNTELTAAERKRRLAYAGGGVLVAVLTAGLGVRWWRNRR